MKKRIKIRWKNVLKLAMLLISISFLIHDFYVLTIKSMITGNLYGLTWFGVVFDTMCIMMCSMLVDDYNEEQKKIADVVRKRSNK